MLNKLETNQNHRLETQGTGKRHTELDEKELSRINPRRRSALLTYRTNVTLRHVASCLSTVVKMVRKDFGRGCYFYVEQARKRIENIAWKHKEQVQTYRAVGERKINIASYRFYVK